MSDARRFIEKSARTPGSLSPLKLQRHLVRLLAICTRLPTAIQDQIANSYTDLSAAFYLLHKAVGNGAMHKFGNCNQWRSEFLIPRMLLFSVGNDAMNAP
jgi:hypothetical protein